MTVPCRNRFDRIERLSLDASGSATTTTSIATEGHIAAPGGVRHYQAWYRDPNLSPCGTGSNFTNGVTIGWL